MPDDNIPDAPISVAGESSMDMSKSSRPPESGDQPASHVETSFSRPTTRTPRTRRRYPLSSAIHKIRNEARDNILATVGVVAALIALFPLAWSISDWFGAEPIRIESSPIAFSSGQFTSPNLVIPRPLAELERPPNYGRQPEKFMDWAHGKGAVFADEVALSFVVKSDMDEPTYLVGARVTVLRRDAPMKGTWIAPDGAGPKADRLLFVNLDTSPPELTKEIGWDFPLEVSKADAELFTVLARTSNCHCFWQLELDILTPDNEKTTVIVDDAGKPFELTGSRATTARTAIPYDDSQSWPR